ncbi:MAG: hypothetical protein GX799_07275 [Crenarchaeota archaeon]|nr:hypothetical protein [Thermoproteota archaeon]
MKQTIVTLLIVSLLFLTILPTLSNDATALTSYNINQVDHTIEVLYSGNVIITDTIYVTGKVTDTFTIALPYIYSTEVLKVLAYDQNNVYTVNLGVPMGNHSGFYGVKINFEGNLPSIFSVAFVLSNRLIIDQGNGNFVVGFPVYPSLEQTATTCNVEIKTPSAPLSISIGKEDGNITETKYTKKDLPPYTYAIAESNLQVTSGAIQSSIINSLKREISIDTIGSLNAVDTYHITSNTSSTLTSYVLCLPMDATRIEAKDTFGNTLATNVNTDRNLCLLSVTLVTPMTSGQSTDLMVNYKLPGAKLQGSQYVLSDFELFTNCQYVVQQATMTFNPPEGATIITPQVNQLDSSSTITRGAYQDALTVKAEDISAIDYLAPQKNTIHLTYDYNPVWVSFRPTFWAALVALLGCVGAVVYRKRKPKTESYEMEYIYIPTKITNKPVFETVKGAHVTSTIIREFTDAYEDKKHLNTELRAVDIKAQKGKIPRRQYKAQRSAIETRIDSLTRNIERHKAIFRGASGSYPDLIKQLDVAESELEEAEENMRMLQAHRSKGEIPIESYKKNIADAQKLRDKAESVMNGILMRLREKIR